MAYIDGTKTTGMGSLVKPAGYDIMCTFLLERHIVNADTFSCGVVEPCVPSSTHGTSPPAVLPSTPRTLPSSSGPSSTGPSTPGPSSPRPAAADAGRRLTQASATSAEPANSWATPARSAKRKRVRPQSRSEVLRDTISNFQRELRQDSREANDMFASFIQSNLQNQRDMIAVEQRKADLLEKLLDEIKKSK